MKTDPPASVTTRARTAADVPSGGDPVPNYFGLVTGTARGVLYSAGGQVLLFLAGLAGGIFLARLLSPRDFGIYAVIGFVVHQVNSLATLGLSSKLIHDDDEASTLRQRSVFTLHLLVALAAYALIHLAAPWLAVWFHIGSDAAVFCRAVALMVLITPFGVIPTVTLSRRLQYERLTLADVTEAVVYQCGAVTFAWLGLSYWCFGVAALLSAVARTLVLNLSSPWHVGLAWDGPFLRQCLRFGGRFQLASLTHVPRDNIITFLGGPLFGPAAVGLLNWAHRLAWVCSQTYVGVCAVISFPSLCRMRAESGLFEAAVARMLRYSNLGTVLTLSVTSAVVPEIVRLVFTEQWSAAIPFFYCFAIRMVAGTSTTLFDLALRAAGRPDRSLRILSFWTAWEWALSLIGVALFGYRGIAVAAALGIWPAAWWLYRELSRVVHVDLWRACVTPLCCGAIAFLTITLGKGDRIHTVPELLLAMVGGGLIFAGAAIVLEGPRFASDIKSDLGVLFNGVGRPASLGDRREGLLG